MSSFNFGEENNLPNQNIEMQNNPNSNFNNRNSNANNYNNNANNPNYNNTNNFNNANNNNPNSPNSNFPNNENANSNNNPNNNENANNNNNPNFPNSNFPNNENANPQNNQGNNNMPVKEEEKRIRLSMIDKVKIQEKESKPKEVPQLESKVSRDFRNMFQTIDQTEQIYNKRKLVMTFSVFYMIFSTVILEVLCLYLGCCFGEKVELEYYLSHSIIPLFIILIAMNYLTYTAADYVLRTMMKFLFSILFVYSGVFLGFGIYAVVLASQLKTDNTLFTSRWNLLSLNSKMYYFSNSMTNLINSYFTKMIVVGVIYLFTGIVTVLNCFFLWDYNDKISDNWKPQLKSRMSDEKKKKYIDLKSKLSNNNQENLRQNINDEGKPLINSPVNSNLENLENNGLNIDNNINNANIEVNANVDANANANSNVNNNPPPQEHVESQFNRSETETKLNNNVAESTEKKAKRTFNRRKTKAGDEGN